MRRCRNIALRIPSAVVQGEFNILVNPAHRLFTKVKIRETEPFAAIKRMYGSRP